MSLLTSASEDGNARRDSSTSQDLKPPSDGQKKQTVKAANGRGYLEVPLQSSFRPSFGSLSDISSSTVDSDREEVEDHASRSLVHGGARPPFRSSRPESTLRQRANGAWARNKGLMLVILSQLFGALMGVTTRLLETNGAHGRGMHPFQVTTSNAVLRDHNFAKMLCIDTFRPDEHHSALQFHVSLLG